MRRWMPALALLAVVGCNKETRISEIDPNTGTFSGGEEVVIRGAGFPRSGVQVKFGTREATALAVESDHSIKVTTPAGDKGTTSDVSVIFDDGRAFVLKNSFRYVDSTQQRATMDKFFAKQSGEKPGEAKPAAPIPTTAPIAVPAPSAPAAAPAAAPPTAPAAPPPK